MRALFSLALSCLALPGCDFRKESSTLSVFVVDSAELAPIDRSGKHWCAYGVAPSVVVTVQFGRLQTTTSAVQSATPAWNAPTLIAPDAAWSRGILLEARGECDGNQFSIAAVVLHPPAQVVEHGGLLLQDVGGLRSLRLHFARVSALGDIASAVAWYPYAVVGDVYVNGDTSAWPVYDDGSDTWDDGDYGDSTTFGDVFGSDYGGVDPGGVDPGGADPGGAFGGGDGELRTPSAGTNRAASR
jgi:hypothetical protein